MRYYVVSGVSRGVLWLLKHPQDCKNHVKSAYFSWFLAISTPQNQQTLFSTPEGKILDTPMVVVANSVDDAWSVIFAWNWCDGWVSTVNVISSWFHLRGRDTPDQFCAYFCIFSKNKPHWCQVRYVYCRDKEYNYYTGNSMTHVTVVIDLLIK